MLFILFSSLFYVELDWCYFDTRFECEENLYWRGYLSRIWRRKWIW